MKMLTPILCLLLGLLTGCAEPNETPGNATSKGTAAATGPEGRWQITVCSYSGQVDPERVGDEIVITTSGQSTIERSGSVLPMKFTFKKNGADNHFEISIATNEDSPNMGGGGPRLGLLRIVENGNMEMLVGSSAVDNRPKDFSDGQKAVYIYYHATPAIPD